MAMRKSAGLLIVSLLSASEARAQPPVPIESWTTVEALPAGTPVLIDLSSGRRIRGALARSAPDALTLTLPSGEHRELARSAIDRIRSGETRRDGVGNGIGYGALVGAGTTLGFLTWMYAQCDAGCDAPARSHLIPPAVAMSAGIGAAAGFLIDKAIRHRDVLYRRDGSKAGGGRTSVRFGGLVSRHAGAVQVVIVR